MEGARWWRCELGLTEEEWDTISYMHPALLTTAATGTYKDGVQITIFLARLEGPIIQAMVDCWLHEYIEVTEGEVTNHAAFDSTITRVARYVSSP